MLIYINPNVIDAAYKEIKAKNALTMLAMSARSGNHIIISKSIHDFQNIQRIIGLGDDIKEIFRSVTKKLIYYGTLKSKMSVYAEITNDNCMVHIRNEGGQNIIIIPVNYYITHTSIIEATEMVVENLTDARFYEFIGKYYVFLSGFKNMPLRYRALCGGGNTTKDMLKSELDSGYKFVICLADSDKYHSNAGYGDTLKQIRKVFERAPQDHCNLCKVIFSVYVREIENLIPLYLLREVDDQKGRMLESLFDFNPHLVSYFDIKRGLSYAEYSRFSSEMQQIYEEYILENNLCDFELLSRIKKKDEALDYKKRFIEGFGDSVLSVALDECLLKVSHKFEEKVTPVLTESQKKEWMEIGKEIFEWTCAAQPIRS